MPMVPMRGPRKLSRGKGAQVQNFDLFYLYPVNSGPPAVMMMAKHCDLQGDGGLDPLDRGMVT